MNEQTKPKECSPLDESKPYAGIIEGSLVDQLIARNYPLNEISIGVLGLTVRTNNSLKRANVDTLLRLVTCSVKYLLSCRNIGTATVSEIRNKLNSFVRDILNFDNTDPRFMIIPIDQEARLEGKFDTPSPDAGFLDTSLIDQLISRNYPLNKISTGVLGLTISTNDLLKRANVNTVQKLLTCSVKYLCSCCNIKTDTVSEIREKLNSFIRSLLSFDSIDQYLETLANEGDGSQVRISKIPINNTSDTDVVVSADTNETSISSKDGGFGNLDFESEYTDSYAKSLESTICKINSKNATAIVGELILSYVNDCGKILSLLKYFKDCKLVSDININNLNNINKIDYLLLIDFIDWLSMDLREQLYKQISNIFNSKDKRHRSMILARARGMTLEAVGDEYGITRERVRQIEKKYSRKFENYCSRIRPQYILAAFSMNKDYVSTSDIDLVYRDLSDIVIYFFSSEKHEFREQLWIPELDGFVIGDTGWYEVLKKRLDEIQGKIDADEVENLINLVTSCKPVNTETIRRIILGSLTRIGNIYTIRKLTKKDMYHEVIREHYRNGIKLFDNFEMMRFRNHVKDKFGEIELPENNRAICARIAAFSVLCDTGKYILPEFVKFDEALFERIREFILGNERNTLAFYEVFEKFKQELEVKTDITNWHYLQGALRYKYGDEFIFTKDTISKSSAEQKSIRLQIEDCIKVAEFSVTNEYIRSKFLGIAPYTLGMAIADNPEILIWGFGQYLHASKLIIDEDTIERLKNLLDDILSQGTVSTRSLFPLVFEREQQFVGNNKIENHMALFSILSYLFPNDYEFSRPFIAQKGTENINLDSVIRDYLSQFDEIHISELKTYLEDKQIRIMNFSELMENISDEFIRADDDLLIRISKLQQPLETFSSIEESLKGIIGMKGYLAAKNVDTFFFFPDLGVRWNHYLLISLIKRYGQNLKVLKDTVDYRYLTEIFVRSDLGIHDYDELLRYALSYESKRGSFNSIAQIEEFLRAEELINNDIPKKLFDDGTILLGETRITISQGG